MRNNQAGFTVIAALGLGAVLMVSAVGVLAMQRSIIEETKKNAVRHARYVADDILKTQIAIKANQVLNRSDLVTFINKFGDPNSGLRVPIPGTDCGNEDPCDLVLLSSTSNPLGPVIPQINADTTEITLRIGLDPAQANFVKFPIEPIDVKIRVPVQDDMNSRGIESNASYSCNSAAPVFKGLKKVGSTLVADCASVTSTPNTTVASEPGVLRIMCNVSQGNWMASMDSDLLPKCQPFSDLARVPASIEICNQSDQYPLSYALNGKFQVTNKACVTRGSPYDFASKPNQ